MTRKIETLQNSAKLHKSQTEKLEKDLKAKTQECEKTQMRADKAKARNEAKMEKMKDHNAKLKKELMSEKEKCEKMTNEISELKNCLIKSAKVAFFRFPKFLTTILTRVYELSS